MGKGKSSSFELKVVAGYQAEKADRTFALSASWNSDHSLSGEHVQRRSRHGCCFHVASRDRLAFQVARLPTVDAIIAQVDDKFGGAR
jgi:hypothetical protein